MRATLDVKRYATCASALLIAVAAACVADAESTDWRWQGEITAEARWFTESSFDPRQDRRDFALLGQIEGFRDFNNRRDRVALKLRGRADDRDAERNLTDITELYWRRRWRGGELLVGVNQEFWGTTEALHLVDVINQTDFSGSPDGEDKLGQPMIRLSLSPEWGNWDFYVLPGFRERTFPGSRGRLRGPLPILADAARYEAGEQQDHVDVAIRFNHYIGPIEFAFSHFSGTSRLPLFTLADGTPLEVAPGAVGALPPGIGLGIAPLYFLTDQTGFDGTLVSGGWLWKLEAIRGRDPRGRFNAATGGFEYTFAGVGGSGVDVGLIVEYQYDSRPTDLLITSNDDWVAGARFAFNDFSGSELLILASTDAQTRAGVISLEASRRFGSQWKGSLEARYFSAGDGTDALSLFSREDYWQFSLTRFF
ncbi:MAG: hypothetical protein AAFQ99_00440 [Pseudomonadota bacterium]